MSEHCTGCLWADICNDKDCGCEDYFSDTGLDISESEYLTDLHEREEEYDEILEEYGGI